MIYMMYMRMEMSVDDDDESFLCKMADVSFMQITCNLFF